METYSREFVAFKARSAIVVEVSLSTVIYKVNNGARVHPANITCGHPCAVWHAVDGGKRCETSVYANAHVVTGSRPHRLFPSAQHLSLQGWMDGSFERRKLKLNIKNTQLISKPEFISGFRCVCVCEG